MNGINTNSLDACKTSILDIPEMQGGFDIAASHFLEFISMAPYLQKNSTAKVSSVTRSGGGSGGGRGSGRGSGMPDESDV